MTVEKEATEIVSPSIHRTMRNKLFGLYIALKLLELAWFCRGSKTSLDIIDDMANRLQAGRFDFRIPIGVKYFCLIQTVHKVSGATRVVLNMYWGSFPGVMRSGRYADHSSSSSAEVKHA